MSESPVAIPRFILRIPKSLRQRLGEYSTDPTQVIHSLGPRNELESSMKTINTIWNGKQDAFLSQEQIQKGAIQVVQKLFGGEFSRQREDEIRIIQISTAEGEPSYVVDWRGKRYRAVMKELPTILETYANDTEKKHQVIHSGVVTHALYVIDPDNTTQSSTVDGLSPGLSDFNNKFAENNELARSLSKTSVTDATTRISNVVEKLRAHRAIRTPKPQNPLKPKKNPGFLCGGSITITHDDIVPPEPWMNHVNHSIQIERRDDRFREHTIEVADSLMEKQQVKVVAAPPTRTGTAQLFSGAYDQLEALYRMIESEQKSLQGETNIQRRMEGELRLNSLVQQIDHMKNVLQKRLM